MTTELNCSGPASLADVHALDADHVIEAARVAGILSGKEAGSDADNHFVPDEAGVRLHGAWIRGDLNLDGIDCVTGLRLTGCRLDQPLTLRAASLRWLVLEECVLPAVWADQATLGTLTIKNSLVTGRHAEGALRLAGTRVTADLRLTGTRVDSQAGPAVLATGLVVDGSVFMETLDARGTSPGGAVCFTGATIGDDLVLQGARLIAGSGPAFNGEILIVKGAAWLDQGFTATGAGPSGAVCLTGARITRQLSLRGAKLANGSGPALAADLLTVRAGLMADQGFTATGAADCQRRNEGLRATGTGRDGAVVLTAAAVGGQLSLCGAVITNDSGPALVADAATVQGSGCLDEGFTATGGGGRQAVVSLAEAHIGGRLSCTGRAAGGRPGTAALDLGRAQVGGLLLSTGFGAVLNVDGLACAEEPVLLAGNPPSRVPEVRQAAEWRLLVDHGTGARARGTLTRLGQALHLARPAHHQVPDTVPFPRLDPHLPRLVPPPAGAASP